MRILARTITDDSGDVKAAKRPCYSNFKSELFKPEK
jgi:hypothetical protein